MIISMRKFLKKNAQEGMGIFLVVVMLIGIVGIPSFFKNPGEGETWVLRINGYSVGYKAFVRELFSYREFLASVRAMYGQFADFLLSSMGMTGNAERAVTEKLIQQSLLNQYASRIGLHAHAQYITNKLRERKFLGDFVSQSSFNPDGSINAIQLRRELAHYGLMVNEFDQIVHDAAQRAFLFDLYNSVFYIPQFDLEFRSMMMHAARDILVASISQQSVLRELKKTELSSDEVANYFAIQNKVSQRYWIPEHRDGTLWEFKKQLYPVVVSDAEIEQAYEDQKVKKYIKTQARVSVEEISAAALQKEFGEDSLESIRQNPEKYEKLWKSVAPFARGTHEESFERAAFTLRNVGDISGIVTKDDGTMCVVRLKQTFPREYKPLSEVREVVAGELRLQKFKKQFITEGRAAIESGTMETFVQQKGVVRILLEQKIAENSKERGVNELFTLQNTGDYDVFIFGDTGYMIRFDQKVKSHEPTLASVAEVVRNDLYEERASTRLSELVAQLNETSFPDAETFENKLTSLGGEITFRGTVKIDVEEDQKKIEKYSLFSSDVQNMEIAPGSRSFLRDSSAIAVFLRSITPDVAEKLSTTEEQRAGTKEGRAMMFNALVAHLYRDATIEINHAVIMATQEAS